MKEARIHSKHIGIVSRTRSDIVPKLKTSFSFNVPNYGNLSEKQFGDWTIVVAYVSSRSVSGPNSSKCMYGTFGFV